MDAGGLALAAFILTAIGWISRETWRWRKAKRLATEDAAKTLGQKKTLLEDIISKTQDDNLKQTLLAQVDEVNAALLGLYAERLRHTLKEAGLPPEERLIEDGRVRLQPQQVAHLEQVIAEAKILPFSLSTQDLFILANTYYYIQQYQEAKNIYDKILSLNPRNPTALANHGAINSVTGKYDDALADYSRAFALKPDDPDILHNRGKLYEYMGKHTEALADLNRSLELRPDDHYTLNSRGSTYHNLGKYKEALADYNRSLELKPDDALVLSNRGATYKRLEEYDKALADLNCSLKLRPDFYPALINRGSLYERMKNYDKAISDYYHALEVRPDDLPTLYDLARLHSMQGKAGDALEFLKRAIVKDKGYCEVAKINKDFDNIRDDPRFKELIGSD